MKISNFISTKLRNYENHLSQVQKSKGEKVPGNSWRNVGGEEWGADEDSLRVLIELRRTVIVNFSPPGLFLTIAMESRKV